MKEAYLKTNKKAILVFARDCYKNWDITLEQLNEVYFKHFIKNIWKN